MDSVFSHFLSHVYRKNIEITHSKKKGIKSSKCENPLCLVRHTVKQGQPLIRVQQFPEGTQT